MTQLNQAVTEIPKDKPAGLDPNAPYICLRIRVTAVDDFLEFTYEEPVERPDIASAKSYMLGAPLDMPAPTDNPLDVAGDKDQWLLIGFPNKGNIYFSPSDPGLSLKPGQDLEGVYGHLRHVLPDGSDSEAPVDGCKLIYFAAKAPDPVPDYQDGFNLHVLLVQQPKNPKDRTKYLPIILDPDIKYPGPNAPLIKE